MKILVRYAAALTFLGAATLAHADTFGDTTNLFRHSSQSSSFFKNSYGYAVLPTIGEGGFVIAGGHGTGRVYVQGRHVGDTSMTEVSVGPQIGGKAYSQIVFFQNKQAFDNFASGNFEFSADASAVAITAGAQGSAGTTGVNAGASTKKTDATNIGTYHNGMAVFQVVKGGAMLQAAIGGQKYTYTPIAR